MALTVEDFANRCLKIAGGDISLPTPCCANCQSYKYTFGNKWVCIHRKLISNGNVSYLEVNPEDFCSYFDERLPDEPSHSCSTCKHEGKPITANPCWECDNRPNTGKDFWEEKNE